MKVLSPLKAIRQKCLDCCCFSPKEVKLYTVTDCSLYPYRYGLRPATVIKRKSKIEQAECN